MKNAPHIRIPAGVLLAALLVSGCGQSSPRDAARPTGSRHAAGRALASVPSILLDPPRLSRGDREALLRVTSRARPTLSAAARIPFAHSLGSYWVAAESRPLNVPTVTTPAFCLYARGPGDPGPAAMCMDAKLFQDGKAFALMPFKRQPELVGFVPNDRATIRVRDGDKWRRIRARDNVYTARFRELPSGLRISGPGFKASYPLMRHKAPIATH